MAREEDKYVVDECVVWMKDREDLLEVRDDRR